MSILIVSATPFEVLRLRQMLSPDHSLDTDAFRLGNLDVNFLMTGIGMTNTALHLGHYLSTATELPRLVIHAGVAGSYDRNMSLGSVGMVVSETYADLGAEMADGSFHDFFEMGLMRGDATPFTDGRIINQAGSDFQFLNQWNGLTVQRVSGTQPTIDQLCKRYPYAQIESMEGAAFAQTCTFYGVPYLAIRSLSNYVEVRNRANWKLAEAIEALSIELHRMLEIMSQ